MGFERMHRHPGILFSRNDGEEPDIFANVEEDNFISEIIEQQVRNLRLTSLVPNDVTFDFGFRVTVEKYGGRKLVTTNHGFGSAKLLLVGLLSISPIQAPRPHHASKISISINLPIGLEYTEAI